MRFYYMLSFWLVYVASQSLLRLALAATGGGTLASSAGATLGALALGVLYDAAAGLAFSLPLALFFLLPGQLLRARAGVFLRRALVVLLEFLIAFSSAALFLFWQEFHTNFNFIAVDYLIYTQEMIENIRESYPMGIILPGLALSAIALTALVEWLARRLAARAAAPGAVTFAPWRRAAFVRWALLCLLLPALSLVPQDSWRTHAFAAPADAELAGNGPACFVHAFFANELDYPSFYATISDDAVRGALRTELAARNAAPEGEAPTSRRIEAAHDDRQGIPRYTGTAQPNIVIITVESLSSDYSRFFGGDRDYTPQMDTIAQDAFTFRRMYATGTRTVRGLEAISLSVPPTPGQSILRRPDNDHLQTLGSILAGKGYACDFLYGGDGFFDNMNDFFRRNGYAIKDRATIPSAERGSAPETVWGVADEVLYTQVLRSLDEHAAAGEPAFEMVMTTSNHRPFTFPRGRDAAADAHYGTREGACRYSDWAIGDFLRRAREHDWFGHTIFVIVADHQASAAGRTNLPVNRYHIPALVYAPGRIAAGGTDRLTSQIDLAPTLLGMLGLSYDSQLMGHDIAETAPEDDRAFISTYQLLGYLSGDRLTILSPDRKAQSYHIDDWGKSIYTPLPDDAAADAAAISWYQGASMLYHRTL